MSTVVHFVHLVHAVHGGRRGGLLGFGDDFTDHRLGYSNLGGDVTVVQTLLVEFYNTHIALDDVVVIRFGEVVFLRLRVQEVEADHVIVFAEFEDHHGTGSVGKTAVTDFQLLDEAEVFVLGAEADGEDAVKVIEQFLRSCEVVLGDGCPGVALGRVGDDEDGPGVLLLEFQEFHHEGAGILAFFGVVAEIADVVHDDDGGLHLKGGFLDVAEDAVFPVFEIHAGRYDGGTEEVVGEAVQLAGFLVGVAVLELLGREFAIEIQDAETLGDSFGDLDCEEGFTDVGIGKEAGNFALVPELVVKGLWVGLSGGINECVVDTLDGKHVDVGRVRLGFHCCRDSLDGIDAISCFHPYGS